MNHLRLLRSVLMLLVFLSFAFLSNAQEVTVSGKVTDGQSGKPIQGVTVKVKNNTAATQTNENGVFSLKVPSSESVLTFSYIGYIITELKAGTGDISVSLKQLDSKMDEVVVVGYGAVKKPNLTGAIQTLKPAEVEDLPVGNLGVALQGRMLGVSVSGGTARPGTNATIQIRNPATYSKDGGSLGPLYVIDGVVQVTAQGLPDATQFNLLDPTEVESISVLKDATAAVYGSRGAQGVILITTKRGKTGQPKISYNGSYGVNDEAYRTKMLSAYDFARYMNIMNGIHGAKATSTNTDAFFSQDELERFKTTNYDWLEPVWKSAHTVRHTLNVSGGSDRATYFASGSYYTQNGNLSSLDYNKWTFRAGADVNVATGLKTGLQVAGNYGNRVKTFNKIGGENDENDYRNLLLTPRYIPMYVGDIPVKVPGTDAFSGYHFYEIERLGNLAESKDKTLSINAFAEYEIPFVKGLKTRLNYARNFSNSLGSQVGTGYLLYTFNTTGANGHIYDSANTTVKSSTRYTNGDRLYYSNTNSQMYQVNFTTSYARQFGKHNVSALFSVEKGEASDQQQDVWKEQPINGTNGQFGSAFGVIDGRTFGNESGTLGYIGRVNYTYADKYLFDFTFRTDASTHFAPENQWGKFYSASAGWVISKEKFFNVRFIDFLKIRYSAGLVGKDDTKPWQWRQRYTYQGGKGLVLGGNSAVSTGMKMEASPNRDAHWSTEFKNNVGIDASFLRSRLNLTLEGFYNKGVDLLMEKTELVPITVGGTVAAENWGKVNAFGYEVSLGWSDRIGKNFNYGVTALFNWYDNKMVEGNFGNILNLWDKQPGQSDDNGVWGYDYIGMFKSQDDINSYVKQYNITSVFGTTAANLKPGMLYYKDIRGARQVDGTYAGPDGIIDVNDQIQLAKKSSNHYGFGLNFKLGYKGIMLDAVVGGSFGGWSEIDGNSRKKMNNSISRNFQSRPEYWNNIYDSVLNPAGTMPNPNWDAISLSPTSNFWKVSGFRMGMRNANLSYTLPKSLVDKVRISNARIYFAALNPFTFYNPFTYKAADGAYDTYPNLRTFSAGISLTL